MSHQSRVCAVLFDVENSAYESAARFWSGALGRELAFDPAEKYTTLAGEIDYLVQNADPGHEGMHIDIETNNVDAEVARLEALGATRSKAGGSWLPPEAIHSV